MLAVTETAVGIRITVHVQPRAKSPGVGGLHGDALKVRVSAAPVDGAANAAVIAAVAAAFGVPTHAVELVAGGGSRRKVLAIAGVRAAAALALANGSD